MTLIDRVIEHLNAIPLPARPDLIRFVPWPNAAHGEHNFDVWCAVCTASGDTDALRALVAEVLSFAEAEAHREDRLRREAASVSVGLTRERIADLFNVPAELLGAPRPAPLVVHARGPVVTDHDLIRVACGAPVELRMEVTADPGQVTCGACRTATGAPLVHAYEWFIDPRFDGLTVACQEPITAAGLRATAVREDVTCPACLDRISPQVDQ